MSKATKKTRKEARAPRKRRVRARISGTASRPRLSVFRSATHVYAQLIDDEAGKTVAAANDLMIPKKDVAKLRKGDDARTAKNAVAYAVGKMIGEKGTKAGIESVVFDRNGFAFSGRVKAVADGARESGLKF